jgi:hypothetical protein
VVCSAATGSAECIGTNTFEFLSNGASSSSVTITVTNTYVPDAPAPTEVVAQARFTG